MICMIWYDAALAQSLFAGLNIGSTVEESLDDSDDLDDYLRNVQMVAMVACTQALLGHISTGQATTAEAMAAAGESGNAGHELVYLQVILMRICVSALRGGVPPPRTGVGLGLVYSSDFSATFGFRFEHDQLNRKPSPSLYIHTPPFLLLPSLFFLPTPSAIHIPNLGGNPKTLSLTLSPPSSYP